MKIWFILTITFMLAFSVTFVAVGRPGTDPWGLLSGPLWAMYGEFELEGTRAMSGVLGEAVLWMYVLVSSVLLVNLLIAMMSDTYSKIKDNADVEWKFGRVNSVLEAVERTHPVPPPFSAPLMLFRFVKWILGKTCYGDDRCCS